VLSLQDGLANALRTLGAGDVAVGDAAPDALAALEAPVVVAALDAEHDFILPAPAALKLAGGDALGDEQLGALREAFEATDVQLGPAPDGVPVAALTVDGEPCLLLQRAGATAGGDDEPLTPEPARDEDVRDVLDRALRDIPLRVWAEVGRAQLRTIEVAALSDGALVELDRAAEDPVDLYVNGSRIGTGRLICIDGKEWAVQLEHVFAAAEQPAA
jgi:flagellar motor switch protein FliN